MLTYSVTHSNSNCSTRCRGGYINGGDAVALLKKVLDRSSSHLVTLDRVEGGATSVSITRPFLFGEERTYHFVGPDTDMQPLLLLLLTRIITTPRQQICTQAKKRIEIVDLTKPESARPEPKFAPLPLCEESFVQMFIRTIAGGTLNILRSRT